MESHIGLGLAAIAVCLVTNALFSVAESAFTAVNKIKVRGLADKGDTRAMAVEAVLSDLAKFFSIMILSQNLFTVMATSIGTVLAIGIFGQELGMIVSTALLTYLTVVLAESVPKSIAVTHAERLTFILARPFTFYIKITSPLVWIFHSSSRFILGIFGITDVKTPFYVTEEEIKAMINIGGQEGAIEEDEKKLLNRVFEFGDTEVSETMVPRTAIISIDETASVQDVMKLVAEHGYSRYPVIKDNIDNIVGILYIKDILITMAQTNVESLPISSFMRDAIFIPENKMVTELLDEMKKNKFHIAIVADEYGGTAGLVTLEDMMEEIVGGLEDEFETIEAQKDIEIIDEHTFIVSGQTGLDEVKELIGYDLPSEDFNTIGGLVFGLFGRVPKVGEQVRFQMIKFLIMEMEQRKITKIKITKL